MDQLYTLTRDVLKHGVKSHIADIVGVIDVLDRETYRHLDVSEKIALYVLTVLMNRYTLLQSDIAIAILGVNRAKPYKQLVNETLSISDTYIDIKLLMFGGVIDDSITHSKKNPFFDVLKYLLDEEYGSYASVFFWSHMRYDGCSDLFRNRVLERLSVENILPADDIEYLLQNESIYLKLKDPQHLFQSPLCQEFMLGDYILGSTSLGTVPDVMYTCNGYMCLQEREVLTAAILSTMDEILLVRKVKPTSQFDIYLAKWSERLGFLVTTDDEVTYTIISEYTIDTSEYKPWEWHNSDCIYSQLDIVHSRSVLL